MDDFKINCSLTTTHSEFSNETEIIVAGLKQHKSYTLAFLLTILIIVISVGNILVILAVFVTPKLKTITNCFVVSLAISDLLVAIIVIPPAIVTNIKGVWPYGQLFCDLWVMCDIMLCSASILNLCAISLDRYFAITQPLKYSKNKRSKNLAFLMILLAWFLAILISLPPIFGLYDEERQRIKTCRYNRHKGYVVFSSMMSFYIPMLVMIYVYGKISYVIYNRDIQVKKTSVNTFKKKEKPGSYINESDSDGNFASFSRRNDNFEQETIRKSKLLKRKRLTLTAKTTVRLSSTLKRETKTAKTVSLVVGGFLIFWLPFFVYYILIPYLPPDKINSMLMAYFTLFGWFNSAINPFIYAFHNVDFRKAFCSIIMHPLDTFRNRHHTFSSQCNYLNIQNSSRFQKTIL